MRQFCFANLVVLLKEHAINKKISNDEFVGELFCCICDTCEIYNKNGENYWSAKEFTSLILNRKEDLPAPIRQCLLNVDASILNEGLASFYKSYINKLELNHLYQELINLYCNDSYIVSDKKDYVQNHEKNTTLITYLLIQTANINNKITEIKHLLYKQGKTEIFYSFDDIIKIGFNFKDAKRKKIVVIPVDADFHMHVSLLGERPVVVSEKTIHGKWIQRMQKEGFNESEIINMVAKGKLVQTNLIGGISTVTYKNTEFILLAISKFDENNVAHSTKSDLINALESLIKYYDNFGNGYDLYIPLIGTGSSRAKLYHHESFEMIKTFAIQHINSFNGIINIVIFTKDQNEMEEFINYVL